jgi:hypothetical protein
MASLGEELPELMKEIRDDVLPVYQQLGPAGAIAVTMMKSDLDAAVVALAEPNVIDCIRLYECLKVWRALSCLVEARASVAR